LISVIQAKYPEFTMAKKLKIKLPKRVAGVKIPKRVRKGPIAGFLNSGAGQLILAQTLVAAAGVFAASKTDPDSQTGDLVRHPVDRAKRAGRAIADVSSDQTARLSYALKEASRAFRTAMERGPEAAASSAQPWPQSPYTAEEVQPVAKKKHSTRADPNASH
jgi:hypothetical protein